MTGCEVLRVHNSSVNRMVQWRNSDSIFLFSDVRKNFEKKRNKQLTVAERKIFRDIAVDYVTRRLEILENQDTAGYLAARGVRTTEVPGKVLQQKRKLENSNTESNVNDNGFTSQCKNKMTEQKNESQKRENEENQEVDSVFKKYKFGRYRSVAKPLNVKDQETDNEETQILRCSKNSSIPDKEREDSFRTRNELALLDARVTETPPKKLKKKTPRKASTKQVEQQSLIGQWITPGKKMKVKKENKEFLYSPHPDVCSDNDDNDIECITEDSDLFILRGGTSSKASSSFSLHKSSSSASSSFRDTLKGNRLGSAPTDKFNMRAREAEESSSSYQKRSLVDCPMCSSK